MPSFDFKKSEAEFRRAVAQIHNLWCDCGNFLIHLKPRGGWPTEDTQDGGEQPQPDTGAVEGTTEGTDGTEALLDAIFEEEGTEPTEDHTW